jgi:hypothetical protein
MKIKEVVVEQDINEGPIDFVKKVGAGLKSLASGSGFKTGYRTKRAQIERRDDLKLNVDIALGEWMQTQDAIQGSGKTVTVNDVVDWAKNYFKESFMPSGTNTDSTKKFDVTGSPASTDLAVVKQWLTQQFQNNYAAAATNVPAPSTPQLGEPLPAPPPPGAMVNTNLGQFKYDPSGKWIESATGKDAPAEYIDKLNQMWNDQSTIKAAVQFPVKDIPSLMTVNAGEFSFLTRTGTAGSWYQNTGGRATPVTNPATIKRLNEIAKDLNLGQA